MDAFFLVTVKPKCEVRHNDDSIVKLLTFLYLLEFLVRLHMPNICLIKPALLYHDLCMDLIDILIKGKK